MHMYTCGLAINLFTITILCVSLYSLPIIAVIILIGSVIIFNFLIFCR